MLNLSPLWCPTHVSRPVFTFLPPGALPSPPTLDPWRWGCVPTTWGVLCGVRGPYGWVRLDFLDKNPSPPWVPDVARWTSSPLVRDDGALQQAVAGWLHGDGLRFAACGTPFQTDVWSALLDVPMGTTVSYAALAARVGRPQALRAVGQAVGANLLAWWVPCHRAVAAHGLGGFRWGVDRKAAWLAQERAFSNHH